jgi:hypothetical protein
MTSRENALVVSGTKKTAPFVSRPNCNPTVSLSLSFLIFARDDCYSVATPGTWLPRVHAPCAHVAVLSFAGHLLYWPSFLPLKASYTYIPQQG